jgi:hypothetical protein
MGAIHALYPLLAPLKTYGKRARRYATLSAVNYARLMMRLLASLLLGACAGSIQCGDARAIITVTDRSRWRVRWSRSG